METGKVEQTAVNDGRTSGRIDTRLTQRRSGPVRYELISRDGEKIGPFDSIEAARRRAHDLWPLQTQDEERTEGWDVQVVGS